MHVNPKISNISEKKKNPNKTTQSCNHISIHFKQKEKNPEGKGFQDTWPLHQLPCYKTRLNHSKKHHSKKDFLLHKMYSKPNTNNFPVISFPEKSPHLLSHPHPLHLVFISPKHMKLIPRANLWVAKPTATQTSQVCSQQ